MYNGMCITNFKQALVMCSDRFRYKIRMSIIWNFMLNFSFKIFEASYFHYSALMGMVLNPNLH